MTKLYTVKQASKILGFSTNTVYKYLNEGVLRGVRSGSKGRFRIPKDSLEEHLGTKIPVLPKTPVDTPHSPTESSSPAFALTTSRILLLLILLALIADLFLDPNLSISSHLIRGFIVLLLLLLTYQFGGIRKTT